MSQLVELARLYFGFFDEEVVALLLTLPRLYAFLAMSQLLPAQAVPRLPRTAAVLSLAVVAVPINLAYVPLFDWTMTSFALLFLKEFAIGFVLGYVVGWIFWAVQSAGAFIDNQRGAAIAASIDPLQGHETSPLGILFSQAFLTYVFVTGAFLPIIGLLYASYLVWPATLGIPVLTPEFPELALQVADHALRIMVIIAAPVVAVMFLAEFALAMVSRFAPQVQVFILAMPIKSALAILILIFYFSRLLPYATGELAVFEPFIDRFRETMQFEELSREPAASPPAAPGDDPPEAP